MKLFSSGSNSKDIARERLKLVLIHDRANVSPQLLEMLKTEIIKVISNYMEVQVDELDIQLTRIKNSEGDRTISALVANIPIRNVRCAEK
ncbi:MAG: cell division topological specificity factor MinE [Clostridiaceae bacterium]|nr:cell division topological specificity factor MinE [Clostridiaceae bacterium]